ncbi:MAG TPA: M56 family metallopeptidase, partial [Pirellulales bacterium]|nr:M56 family metallopeptidase [Pirellulales bacterium]
MDGNDLARMAGAQVWQVTALIVVVALANRWFAGDRPHLACALWLVVLIKCLTPPLWSSPSSVFSWARATTISERRLTAGAHMVAGPGQIESTQVAKPAPRPALDVEFNVLLPTPIDPATNETIKVGRRLPSIGMILFVGWSLGAVSTLGLAAGRWRACLLSIRGSSREGGKSLDELVRIWSRRLGLRRRVLLLITKNGLGPAVIGLFHPTVLVPEELLRGKAPIDLEPIVVHELIHVRRGDLWLGLLQTLAQATWWFHPLVWWAGRQVCRESERCCDEEVLAELGCDGTRYARSLLGVLELKRRLVPLDSFPGVRPVEVTSKRMERIMRLRQGCHRHTPWWCWLALLSLAAATLPGAGVVLAVGEEEGPSAV